LGGWNRKGGKDTWPQLEEGPNKKKRGGLTLKSRARRLLHTGRETAYKLQGNTTGAMKKTKKPRTGVLGCLSHKADVSKAV